MKQLYTKKITGQVVVKTGLHIGAGNDAVQIGGIDSAVIRNPATNLPYIPGSSIKGKMRSLLEWKLNKISNDGKTHKCSNPDCQICRVFGSANNNLKPTDPDFKKGPTRIIVRDFAISDESKELEVLTEEKSENVLNRLSAEAKPRFIERVVPGVKFDVEIEYRVIDTHDNGKTDEKNFNEVVVEGLKLLQNDYIGGSGSRGYGQIEFVNLKVKDSNNSNEATLTL